LYRPKVVDINRKMLNSEDDTRTTRGKRSENAEIPPKIE